MTNQQHETAPVSEPAPPLTQQITAIQAAISARCIVEANIGGQLRRILGIKESKGVATLLYLDDQQQTTLFFAKPGGRLVFQVTL